MSIEKPIDVKIAVKGLGGEMSIFIMMLGNLESMTLNKVLKDMVTAFDNVDYIQMKDLAHTLKGASAYIGASRLHYVCYFI